MAVLTITDQLTSLEVAKRSGISPDSRRIIEQLAAFNELLVDAPIVEANEGTVDTHLVRTAIPHGQHRGYNEGVGQSSSQTKTVKDVISNIEIYSTVDKQLIDESAHPTEIMQSEQNAFIEGLSQDITDDLVYGNHEADPRYTNGLATRLNTVNNKNCISLQSTTTTGLTSIYLIKWGMDKARIIYPRGSKNAGVEYNYLGEQTVKDANNREYQAYRAHYRVARGLSVGHEMSIIRICNIDLNAANVGESIALAIVKAMPKLARGAGTVSIACNADVKGVMNVAALSKLNILLPAEDPWGNEVLKIGAARFRECPSILTTETLVS
ncbi:MAG: hypothetical protein J6P07_06745 [Spirochaetaceae bacterium]|nr:hypothetical protein [Spirochaetaceae bacterium]MBO7731519.1 hypothetical protein [Methanobrevibacter sp.]